MPAATGAQPLQSRGASSPGSEARSIAAAATSAGGNEQLGNAVVLRWRSRSSNSSPAGAADPSHRAADQALALPIQASDQLHSRTTTAAAVFAESDAMLHVRAAPVANPLRSEIRQVAFQQDPQNPFPMGNETPSPPALPPNSPALPSFQNPAQQPGLPEFSPQPGLNAPSFGAQPEMLSPQLLPNQISPGGQNDPLSQSELPPPPPASGESLDGRGSILEESNRSNPFPPRREDGESPSDLDAELVPPPSVNGFDDVDPRDDEDELKRRNADANLSSCDELRSRTQHPITRVRLDISPDFGEGLRSAKKDPEQQRLDFAASAEVRDWTDYRGYIIATGRLIDLRNGRVVIDVGGSEKVIPFIDLSDVDVAYVGDAWNIPEKCGTGYEPFLGRNYIASTVQWTAPGLCHKPLYFEQVQLERYGHEIGPILQPLVSTAHFFGNIPVLPYKMGIHPPNECQHPLGYFRPGNCAPYMLQPIPLSLRGAAFQAGVVTGAAALLP